MDPDQTALIGVVLFGSTLFVEKASKMKQPLLSSVQYLRKKVNFWNVHGIMNTSGLLQSNRSFGLHFNFARDPKAN